ncbi:hypothetical protein EA187_00520 [Lujinxingia sediminis]|uniref:Tetratricopeptide repeat protein n=1 Tax=Lujinxingia sediminis TaxID=2480984 RepID=A0ABY0CW92_9DELT|nr:hypothetical protein [Lujinxingia sediminis]RVU47953.1 hypothetical protein EA187_00520 [Lujinxingia sediminis]
MQGLNLKTHTRPAAPRGARQSRWVRRLVGALICVTLVAGTASTAFALDKNQIVQMTKLGLDDRAIMGAIDSAGEGISLSAEDVEDLRAQGVSDQVIDHLRRRGMIAGESAPTEQAPVDEGVDPLAPAPAPAPAEGETDYEREERERLEAERQAEIERRANELNAQRDAEAERQRKLERAAAQLPRAAQIVRDGNNMEGARMYLEFLSYEPEQGSENWYEATFGLAKALYQEGILSGASTPLLEVLMAGADKPHFVEAFRMLEELSSRIGYNPPILEELTRFYVGDKNERFQAEFNYYMGKFFYGYNRMDLALEYLDQVPESATDYPESRYLAGVARLDPAVNDIPGALRNFEAAILAAEAAPGGNEDILQLGYLALARVFFEVGFFDVALFYYQKIPSESSRHADAVFESAWSYFMKNDFKRALGAFHTLQSPYYSQRYYPDLYILESTVYLNQCIFPKSQRALAEFKSRYLDQRPLLQAYLENTFEPEAYWQMMEDAYKPGESAPIPRLFTNAVLESLPFYNVHRVVRALQAERAALKANISALGDFGEQVLERVEEQLELKVQEGGIIVQQRLTAVDQELENWELRSLQIEFDIGSEERTQLQQRLQNPNYEAPEAAEAGTTLMVVADDWQPWPFEGEYWLDEVASYRSQMRTECIEQ